VIAVNAAEAVGPTRLRMLTAGSAKLPVVVVGELDGEPAYYVFDVASLQTALTNQLSAISLADTLDLGARSPQAAVSQREALTADAGSPVVENGRLIGVIAADVPERPEPGEEDLARGDAAGSEAKSGRKRHFWRKSGESPG